jgi:hypothetical protein
MRPTFAPEKARPICQSSKTKKPLKGWIGATLSFVHDYVVLSYWTGPSASPTTPSISYAFSFQLTLQAKTVFGQVLHAGSDPTLNASKNFVRIGPRVGITVFGETGIFAGWSASAMYEDQEVLQGQFKSVARFDSTLAYTMPGQEFWSLQLKYVDGRNLDTLERLQQISLGVGLKY